MKLIHDYPPNFDKINKVFHTRGRAIFYAWGDRIYAPHSTTIPKSLEIHERVHGVQQDGDPEKWWDLYIADPSFRLGQEIAAHRQEYAYLIQNANRHERRRALKAIAKRLSCNLYGNIISPSQARTIIGAKL